MRCSLFLIPLCLLHSFLVRWFSCFKWYQLQKSQCSKKKICTWLKTAKCLFIFYCPLKWEIDGTALLWVYTVFMCVETVAPLPALVSFTSSRFKAPHVKLIRLSTHRGGKDSQRSTHRVDEAEWLRLIWLVCLVWKYAVAWALCLLKATQCPSTAPPAWIPKTVLFLCCQSTVA